jgi:hypothetical protein
MKKEEIDHALDFLLAFNGRVHWLEQGYEVRRILAERGIPEDVVEVTDEGNEP